MRNYLFSHLFIVAFLVVITISCVSRYDNKKVITVSILPQKYFIERIAGKDFKINVLIPPGASPATYEPSIIQMKDISNSLVYFRIGYIPFEISWAQKLSIGSGHVKIVNLAQGIDLIQAPAIRHGNHYHAQGIDPHIWTSPIIVKQLAGKILETLIQLSPNRETEYKKNYHRFVKDLETLDDKARKTFKNIKNRSFMIYHPALGYFARDYNLQQIPIELEGKNPSPAHMKDIISHAQKHGITTIFIQKQFSRENARAVAGEINGKVQIIDPLNENWLKEMHQLVDVFEITLN